MPCSHIAIPGGGHAIICGPRHTKRCRVCGGISTKLCDYEVRPGKTCDAPLCSGCAVHTEPNLDYCPSHPRKEIQPCLFPTK
jgi:hypothetical protein